MYRVTLAADGIADTEGAEAALDIAKEFNEVRAPRYVNAICSFSNGILVLACDNDGWDADGKNLMDEFSDCIVAFVPTSTYENLRLVSAVRL